MTSYAVELAMAVLAMAVIIATVAQLGPPERRLAGAAFLVAAAALVVLGGRRRRRARARSASAPAAFLPQAVTAAEQVRSQTADDIHDGPVQRLTAMLYDLERASSRSERGDEEAAAAITQGVRERLRAEIGGLRRMTNELRPPALGQRGLPAVLADYAATLSAAGMLDVSTHVSYNRRLAPELEVTLYRISQEALKSIAKQPGASVAHVSITEEDDTLVIHVRGDGRAADPDIEEHLDLQAVERTLRMIDGEWHIHTDPGGARSLVARIPLDADAGT